MFGVIDEVGGVEVGAQRVEGVKGVEVIIKGVTKIIRKWEFLSFKESKANLKVEIL
jgi:hypothetical protein